MSCLRRIAERIRTVFVRPHTVDGAIQTLRKQLRGQVNATVIAQAEARLRRRLFQGVAIERANRLVVAWALQAQHLH
jgi:hypothetical protein